VAQPEVMALGTGHKGQSVCYLRTRGEIRNERLRLEESGGHVFRLQLKFRGPLNISRMMAWLPAKLRN
jgi:hypothetical protein